ncbi:ABC transporter ATP-binding protein, partial [Lysobacter sp. 2RAB21]
RKAQRVLVALDGVLSVAQIGNSLRVLLADADTAESNILAALREAGLDAEVNKAKPNLEDVFVSATRGRDAPAPAAEAAA